MKWLSPGVLGMAALLASAWLHAQDASQSEEALSIHGNQEQPTVMYIVPWQSASDSKALSNPNKPPLHHIFQQVERREHEREIGYLLNQDPDKPAPARQ